MLSTTRRVEFRDTDAAGIMHFSAFFPMMESAEHELLRSWGMSVMPRERGPNDVTWPRVAATCDYLAAARFEDILAINVSVLKVGNSSVQYGFDFSRDETPIAKGTLTAVCCRLDTSGLTKVPIPDSVRQLMQG
ncbi:1,4-dihydroxy-2-naphthoyl-CoA hydrolase [Rubripirellula amarantea]|uniref:1,4-dihydroxy-2-naphthoyl-CoA hydrolase n=1 Tax=Rubripirellula amarantea TaxID=2527999 RepID=A0A5C5WDY3_9BACT|nr:thioesterase family protein [Rubripirellula amarantea]TWT49176.1 1,4-dihydroxy-2-naphthoyl-CoA hydrolase [Rubripirellula amarantea]